MPNQIAKDRVRVSYIEDKDIAEGIEAAAAKARTSASALIREATYAYLDKLEQEGTVTLTLEKRPRKPSATRKK